MKGDDLRPWWLWRYTAESYTADGGSGAVGPFDPSHETGDHKTDRLAQLSWPYAWKTNTNAPKYRRRDQDELYQIIYQGSPTTEFAWVGPMTCAMLTGYFGTVRRQYLATPPMTCFAKTDLGRMQPDVFEKSGELIVGNPRTDVYDRGSRDGLHAMCLHGKTAGRHRGGDLSPEVLGFAQTALDALLETGVPDPRFLIGSRRP